MASIFEDAVRRAFSFLESNFQYRCSASEDRFVRFESRSAFVSVSYDRLSFEIAVRLGRRRSHAFQLEPSFSLGQALGFMKAAPAEGLEFLQASTPERIVILVEKAAAQAKQHLEPLLTGSKQHFRALTAWADKEVAAYEASERLSSARYAAEAAWADKDYKRYVSALAPWRASLRPSETKKLAYAERKALALKHAT